MWVIAIDLLLFVNGNGDNLINLINPRLLNLNQVSGYGIVSD